jgi:hypothetical protein
MLGEAGYNDIYVQCPGFLERIKSEKYGIGPAPLEVAEARRLFPEADILVMEGDVVMVQWFADLEWPQWVSH